MLADLLGASEGPEEERIRASGLPRSTYQDAKLRLYSQGVLEDRYVPSPLALGIPRVSFVLSRPFADDLPREAARLERRPSVVLLWRGSSSVLAVEYGEAEDPARGTAAPSEATGPASDRLVLSVDPSQPSVPVYFDLEGAFVHLCGSGASRRYPRHLPTWSAESPGEGTLDVRAVRTLVRRPFEARGPDGPAYPTRPASLPRSERKVLAHGAVDWRVFANPSVLPSVQGRKFSHVLFIHGALREGAGVDRLFRDLVQACSVYPFLLASDGTRVLLGGLAAASDPTVKHPTEPPRPRESVVTVLGRHVQSITIVREELAQLEVRLSHRYDRVLPA